MWFTYPGVLSIYYLIGVCAKHNDLIYDYFTFKETPSIVGFTCDVVDGDLSFLRKLNTANFKIMLFNSESINSIIYTGYYKLGIFIDLRYCNTSIVEAALSDAADHQLYDELHLWLIQSYNLESVLSVIDDSSFGISTDFVVASGQTDKKYTLYDVYNPWKQGKGELYVTQLASWDWYKGFHFYLKESKIRRRSNLHGMIFTTSFYESKFKPANMSFEKYLRNFEKNPVDGWSKFGYVILQLASEIFNVTIHIKKTTTWKKNSKVGAMSSALNNYEIDICGNPVRLTIPTFHMYKVVYPSWPLSPQPRDLKITNILRPFAPEVWILTVLTALGSSIILVIALNYEYKASKISHFSNALLLTLGGICLQSTTINLNNISTRVVFLFILVLGYFINNYYSACIVSVRLDETVFKINDSLNELAKTGLRVASEPISYFDCYIRENEWETNSFYTQRWVTTPENERFILPDQGMQLVKQGSHAYHTYPDVAYPFANRFYTNREICELTEVNLVKLADQAMAVTYNSTVVELMKVGLSRLTEHGIRRRWLNWLTAKKPRCRKDIISTSSITIEEFAPHFYIVAFGWIFALIVCAVEIFIDDYVNRMEM